MDTKNNLNFKKVEPAYVQVADQLRSLIVEGEIRPGELLPPESKLMSMFSASRSTVREAIRLLSSEHLVVTTRGARGGTSAGVPSRDQVSAYLERSIGMITRSEGLSVDNFLEIRMIFEVPAAGLAAKNRTEEQVQKLFSTLRPTGEFLDHGHLFDGNSLFHSLILEASGNELMQVVASPIFVVLRTQFLRDKADASFWDEVDCDHLAIAEAIKKRNSVLAEKLMKKHLENLRSTYENLSMNRIKI
jgi:DNA-binding FadR family transcriptional regulator